jgi:tRNA modification GTPase
MTHYNLDDTIAAISTLAGESGIGIVRLSGKKALEIADRIFASKDGKRPASFKTYTLHYGWVKKQGSGGSAEIIDEALLTVMRAPRSYTKEDVVEINCHGGMVALRRVLDLVLENGARPADPGEFTKRAFLNGRIDLSQAEAVLDVIRAKTDSALRLGLEQLQGSLTQEVNKIREILLDALSVLEAQIDFPEVEVDPADLNLISRKLNKADQEFKRLLSSAAQGRMLREGLRVVICGRPNVGKSSLLNALLKEERAIVTPVAGTTRDAIEDIIDIQGIPIRIMDTAGIIEPRGLVEKKAVARSREHINAADLVILLFDGSKKLNQMDEFLIRRLKDKKTLAVINKIDLLQRIKKERILKIFGSLVEISAKRLKNIKGLEDAIAYLVYGDKITAREPVLVSNLRHSTILKKAEKLIAEALKSLDNKLYPELIAQDLKDALGYIDEILGKKFSESLLERIFSQFCIGK